MRFTTRSFALCFPLCVLLPGTAQARPAERPPPAGKIHQVVIDPGHGGQDLGATRDTFVEARIVLQVAEKLRDELQKDKTVKVTLTRHDARGIALKDRVQIANDLGADLFVSLHANTAGSDAVTGMEFYFNSLQSIDFPLADVVRSPEPGNREVLRKIRNDFAFYDKTAHSLRLTRSLQKGASVLEQKSVIKRAQFFVIDHTSVPSALVELGFISNRQEAEKLVSPEFQEKIARRLSEGIRAYLQNKEKSDKAAPL